MDLSVAAVGSGTKADAGAEHKAQSVSSAAHATSAAGRRGSAPVRFTVRTAGERELALLGNAENKRGQNEACKIRSSHEEKVNNAHGEDGKMKQAERPRIKGADQAAVGSFKVKSEIGNLDKLTEISKPVSGQARPNSRAVLDQPQSGSSGIHTDRSETWAPHRGRPQWRRVNAPNRSKSLDWGSESSIAKGKLQVQSLWESRFSRRAESLERGGREERPDSSSETVSPTSNMVMFMVKMYNSTDKAEEKPGPGISSVRMDNSLSGKPGNSYQSLPSRIKLSKTGSSQDTYTWNNNLHDLVGNPGLNVGAGTADPLSGTRKAGGPLANQSTVKMIKKLYGSNNLDAGSNQDEAKANCDHAKDFMLHNRLEVQQGEMQRTSVDDQQRSMAHNGQKGATFPRRSSERENTKRNLGTTFKNREKDRRHAFISSQGTNSILEQAKENSPAEVMTPLRDIEGAACKQLQPASPDTSHNRAPNTEQQRSQRAKPGKNKALLSRDPPLPSRGRELEKEDRGWDYKICKKEKEDDKVQGIVQNGVRGQEVEEWIQAKPLKVTAFHDRSPTLKFSTTTDSPLLTPPLASQETSSAAGKLKEQPKEDIMDHLGAKTEPIQPVSKLVRMEDKHVFKESTPPKAQETKPSTSRSEDNLSTDSVRSKIHRFEAMALKNQTSQIPLLRSRRAFSVQEQPWDVAGSWMKKSGLDNPSVGMKEKEAPGNDVIRKNVHHKEEGENRWLLRSFSEVEAGESRGGRYKEVWGSDSMTQPNHREKTSLHSSTPQTTPQESLRSNPAESRSLKVRHADIRKVPVAQQDISHPSKICLPYQHTNCKSNNNNNNNGTPRMNEEVVSTGNVHGSTNASGNLAKGVSSGSRNGSTKAGSTNPDYASKGEPQASVSAHKTSGPASAAKQVPSSVTSALDILNPPGLQSEASNVLPLQFFGPDPDLHTKAALEKKDGSITLSNVNTATLGSKEEDLVDGGGEEEEEEEEEDDDDDSTEKGDSNYDSDSAESSVTITSNMSQSDRRSFSISLGELYYFGGVEYASPTAPDEESDDCMSHRTASLSSDASAFSSVSLLTTEELDSLISDVRGLGDESFQRYEDVQVVVLHKEVGCGLGFTVAGGVDQNKVITVHKVFPGGLAAQEGSIQEGDQVLSINGTALQNCAHWEALHTLRRAKAKGMAVVVLQKGGGDQPQTAQTEHVNRASDPGDKVKKGRTLEVMLNKSGTDLGFSLEGGLDFGAGDRPITVKKVFQGGPVNEVSPGDELLEIAGSSLRGLRRLEVWNLIKKIPPGPVEVVLHRPPKREGAQNRTQS